MLRLLIALGVVALSGSPAAQAVPDFSGRWVAVSPGSAAGQVLVITQDEASIKLEPGVLADFTPAYPLSGEAAVSLLHSSLRVASSAHWRDGRLLLVDAPRDPAALRHERTLALDSEGRLILERLRPRTPADAEIHIHSAEILEPTRVLFEKR
jgi:hypothetical protein